METIDLTPLLADESVGNAALDLAKCAARDTFRTCADAADEFADIIATTKLVDVSGPTALRLFAELLRISGDTS